MALLTFAPFPMSCPVSTTISPMSVAGAFATLDASRATKKSKEAMKSVALNALRHLRRIAGASDADEDVLSADITPYLPILPAAAREDAMKRMLAKRAPEYACRARQFVQKVTGTRPVTRGLREKCPKLFAPLLGARHERHTNGALVYIARLCRMVGHNGAPAILPSFEVLLEAAHRFRRETIQSGHAQPGNPSKRLTDALSAYRRARKALLAATSDAERPAVTAQFAAVPIRRNIQRGSNLLFEPAVCDAIRAAGHDPADLTPFGALAIVSPEVAADFVSWETETKGKTLSEAYRDKTRSALTRVAGWLVRAGMLEQLRKLEGADQMLGLSVQRPAHLEINSRVARRYGVTMDASNRAVSLLEVAMELEAARSLARSTVTTPEAAGFDHRGRPWLTDSMASDMECVWSVVYSVHSSAATLSDERAREWGLLRTRYDELEKAVKERRLPPRLRITKKNKLQFLRTVTQPQLLCLALPLRRREVHRLRDHWLASRATAEGARHTNPNGHPAVRDASDAYFGAAVPFMMLAIAADDGVRQQQYTHGRLGRAAQFRPVFLRDARGMAVGLASMSTTWDGDLSDPAHLKVPEKGGVPQVREQRVLRPGIVDHEILWDIISVWRPGQLVASRTIAADAPYDLEADMAAGRWSLFPTDSPSVTRPNRSRTDVSGLIGEEQHYEVRSFLRPELPAWDDLDNSWRCLWAAHILRLLVATYWGGVRGDWEQAKWLTMDSKVTLDREYVVLDPYIRERCALDKKSFENPSAYDELMDKLCREQKLVDPLDQARLPMPEHWHGKVPPLPGPDRVRISAARPGQAAPTPPA